MLVRSLVIVSLVMAVVSASARGDSGIVSSAAAQELLDRNPGLKVYAQEGRAKSFYGRAITTGRHPIESAERFRMSLGETNVFGVAPENLKPESLLKDGRHTQPLVYDRATDSYKMTLVYFRQYLNEIPVFRADMRLLVRNEANFPLVMAQSDLRPLGSFTTDGVVAADAYANAIGAAKEAVPDLALAEFSTPEKQIWAGFPELSSEPRLALVFRGIVDDPLFTAAWLFVADAQTGAILYQENEIHDVDLEGTVRGNATTGTAANICEGKELIPLPYGRVEIVNTGEVAFADVDGFFVIPNAGTEQVTVQSEIRGPWFRVFNSNGAENISSTNATPPGPAFLSHNIFPFPATIEIGAQVDAYIHSNVVRDYVLSIQPAYPTIGTESEFEVNVNTQDFICPNNAQYISSDPSINFCLQDGGGGPNMAWSSVVYHEYGHHLVEVAGSGQCQYGEGMSDCVGILVTDESETGFGFLGDCDNPLRDADNNCQFSAGGCTTNCGGPCHSCGRLISGCVWSTRNELLATHPDTYRQILSDLTLNSILLHGPTNSITPEITIHFLMVDDNDANIDNGTPHAQQICAGFGAHGMDCPEFADVSFVYPNGQPETVEPDEPTVVAVNVLPLSGTPVAGTGELVYRIGEGSFTTVAMTEISPNEYEAELPGVPCSETIEYYFQAEAMGQGTVTDPVDAPDSLYSALSVVEVIEVASFDFESDAGWTVSGSVSDGAWDRGVPILGCDRGNPPTDYDGSGACWVTDNSAAGACNSDVDGGTTILTSPVFDLSGMLDPQVSYARWYSNVEGDNPQTDVFVVEVSSNGGGSWSSLETVGPTGTEVQGGWFTRTFNVSDFVTLTNQVRFRFSASDTGTPAVVEAGVDAFAIFELSCAASDAPPSILAHPDDANLCEDETAEFSVNAAGTGPFTYQWFLDDDPILDATSDTLSISNVSAGDEGAYRCEVTNAFGTTSTSEAILDVVLNVECVDTNACTVDSCAAATCINTDNTPSGQCCDPTDGTLTAINDGNACTTDDCQPDGSVTHELTFDPESQCCNTSSGAIEAQDDSNQCTDDGCDGGGNATHVANYDVGTECCDPNSGAIEAIDDGDDCTADVCDPQTGIVDRSVAVPAAAALGSRSISATPAACSDDVALLITSDDHPCVSFYAAADGTASETPVFQPAAAWSSVVIRGADIAPESTYRIQTETSGGLVSDVDEATTWLWADVDDSGVVNLQDALAVVLLIEGSPSNGTVASADNDPCDPNGVINLADALITVVAIGGETYAGLCPMPCP